MQWTPHKTKIIGVTVAIVALIVLGVKIQTGEIPLSETATWWAAKGIIVIGVLLVLAYVRLVDKK